MSWIKNECFAPCRCIHCSRPGAEYSKPCDEYLCEECLPYALELAALTEAMEEDHARVF